MLIPQRSPEDLSWWGKRLHRHTNPTRAKFGSSPLGQKYRYLASTRKYIGRTSGSPFIRSGVPNNGMPPLPGVIHQRYSYDTPSSAPASAHQPTYCTARYGDQSRAAPPHPFAYSHCANHYSQHNASRVKDQVQVEYALPAAPQGEEGQRATSSMAPTVNAAQSPSSFHSNGFDLSPLLDNEDYDAD
jgi:hypothetical protein